MDLVYNNFYFSFYEKRINDELPISNINQCNIEEDIDNSSSKIPVVSSKRHVIDFVPPYLEIAFKGKYNFFATDGLDVYYADLSNFKNFSDYFNNQFSSKSRTKVRSYIKKLEKCFDISYQMFFGYIDEEKYNLLFTKLRTLLESRFEQIGLKHLAFKYWDYYTTTVYDFILKKQASMFVIYDGNKPIDICVNFHFKNIMVNSIRSYDINYSKFRLGFVDIYKQLEWCFENDIEIFDLMYGEAAYKQKWCNKIEKSQRYILYSKKSNKDASVAYMYALYSKYRSRLFPTKKGATLSINEKDINIVATYINDDSNIINDSTLKEINTDDITYEFLSKAVRDFQYHNAEHKSNIKLYKTIEEKDIYVIAGTKKRLEVKLDY